MGLDGVELVMELEDEFAITIRNQDAERIQTTNDAIELIFGLVTQRHEWLPCPTQHAFHRLRRVAGSAAGRLRPSTPLTQLFPRQQRRRRWHDFAQRSGLGDWPELRRPTWVVAAMVVLVVLIALALGLAARHFAAALFPGLVLAIAAPGLTACSAVRLPLGLHTVGDLVHAVTPKLPAADLTREQVRARVRRVVIAKTGAPEDYSDDASFVDDLGLD